MRQRFLQLMICLCNGPGSNFPCLSRWIFATRIIQEAALDFLSFGHAMNRELLNAPDPRNFL